MLVAGASSSAPAGRSRGIQRVAGGAVRVRVGVCVCTRPRATGAHLSSQNTSIVRRPGHAAAVAEANAPPQTAAPTGNAWRLGEGHRSAAATVLDSCKPPLFETPNTMPECRRSSCRTGHRHRYGNRNTRTASYINRPWSPALARGTSRSDTNTFAASYKPP
jgi:hypothetical protein